MMKNRINERMCLKLAVWAGLALFGLNSSLAGPLYPLPSNPRYFTDGSGKAVYLTGSHTWDIFQQWFAGADWKNGLVAESPASFTAYLDVIQAHNHNFVRYWVAETAYSPLTGALVEPQPYVRTGPGTTADGGLKFDLTQLNTNYFNTIRADAIEAGNRGIYVAVMLFDGWGTSEYGPATPGFNTWPYNPFNVTNNINGIDGDPNGDGIGLECHTAAVGSAIWNLQTNYVNAVIDAVNDLDNVLYEICNESGEASTAWQTNLINYIKAYESGKPKQHPVGMTFQYSGNSATSSGTNPTLFNSPADWISPGRSVPYFDDPPAADGSKVIIIDTDHVSSKTTDAKWVWRSFLRGLNPIVMDWWNGDVYWDPIRNAMGYTRDIAENHIDLTTVVPMNALASSGFCLAEVSQQYLAYLHTSTSLTLNLAAGTYDTYWINTLTGVQGLVTQVSGGSQMFSSPDGTANWVLVAKATTIAAPGNLMVSLVSSNQIDLSWTDNSTNETQFRIDRKVGAGTYAFLANAAAVAGSGGMGMYSDTNLSQNTTYTYRVRAEGLSGDSVWSNDATTNTPTAGAGGGTLMLVSAVDVQSNTSAYDLTARGTNDWAHWGRDANSNAFDHKATGGTQISDLTDLGTGDWYAYDVPPQVARKCSWTDGVDSPPNAVAGATDEQGFQYVFAIGSGYSFTVPASPTERTLTVLLGLFKCSAELTATLSDGSAPALTNILSDDVGQITYLYTFTYSAASAGQTLTISYVKEAGKSTASVDIMAAWLNGGPVGNPEFLPPVLNGDKLTLDWAGEGQLEQAPTVNGPWTPVMPVPNPPYEVPVVPGENRFFRLAR